MGQFPLEESLSCFGFCERCGVRHGLPYGKSVVYAQAMMEQFRSKRRLDYEVCDEEADPGLSFDRVLPGDRGHMFGVMECVGSVGETVWLRAFSSLGTGIRDVNGWVPYLVETEVFNRVVLPKQLEIKRLTQVKNQLDLNDPARQRWERERKQISRGLMPVIHDLYQLSNFRGETEPLKAVFKAKGGIPGGVGDCCAPKLLNYAASHGLRPVSIAEFYWGGTNKSGRKQPGDFFVACEEKCQPILGFMLCGIDK